ncbi:uncharacterized protein LOC111717754, partial [Eurytemora carolleeae]|uniref:uncharacterized protein LOC111717754 n=1 Tax=Eurytemora carolleeae TaxID=1294199 RepID=UPI000C78B1CA
MNITEFRKLKRRQYKASWQWAKRRKMKAQRKGSGWSSSASSDINVSQEDIQSESEDRFQVVIDPIGEESDFEDSSTLRDVLGEVHEGEEEDRQVKWPPKDVTNLAKKLAQPKSYWEFLDITVLNKAEIRTWEEGQKFMKRAIRHSESEPDGKRKRVKTKKFGEDNSDSDEEERRLPSKKDTRGKETETDGRPTMPLHPPARKKISLDAGSPLPKRLYTSAPSRFDIPDEIDSVNSVDLTNEVAASPSNNSQSQKLDELIQ